MNEPNSQNPPPPSSPEVPKVIPPLSGPHQGSPVPQLPEQVPIKSNESPVAPQNTKTPKKTILSTLQEQKSSTSPANSPPAAFSKTANLSMTEPMDRRTFLKWSVIGWSAFAAVVAGYGTMLMRYLFPNVLFEPVQTFTAGYPDEYQSGEVSERWKADYGVWIVRDEAEIYALSTVCTHLGCTPNWLPNDNKFKCPCHGSGFYKTGINFEGPAPRPLERFRISLADDGQIVVDKTKKYQQEKGEWSDPESYLAA